jgi:hypothetical protein
MHDVPVVTIIGVLSILVIIAIAAKSLSVSFPNQIEAGNRTNHDSDNPTGTPLHGSGPGVTEDINVY